MPLPVLGGLLKALGSGVEYLTSKRRARKAIRKNARHIKEAGAARSAALKAKIAKLATLPEGPLKDQLLSDIAYDITEDRVRYNEMVEKF